MRKPDSIRRRFLILLLPIMLLVWLLASIFSYFSARNELNQTLEAQLYHMAHAIAGMKGDWNVGKPGTGAGQYDHILRHHEDDYLIVVQDADGSLIYQSDTGKDLPTDLAPGMHVLEIRHLTWKVLAGVSQTDGVRYFIGFQDDEVQDVLIPLLISSFIPMVLGVGVIFLGVTLLVRLGLQPLTRLSGDLSAQSPGSLSPLREEGQPEELKPIVQSLNDLLERIEQFVEGERRFIDDAAHELRTPLTVVKAQCQAIEPDSLDPLSRERFSKILNGVDRAAELAGRLLEQARAEQAPTSPAGPVDTARLIRDSIIALNQLATSRNISVSLDAPERLTTRVHAQDLRTIMDNLIANGIGHAGPEGEVAITAGESFGHVAITVADSGTGIDKEDREKIFERFYRNAEIQRSGTGLGLSIVQSLCRRNGIKILVGQDETLGGALFTLICPVE